MPSRCAPGLPIGLFQAAIQAVRPRNTARFAVCYGPFANALWARTLRLRGGVVDYFYKK